jgi:hypothetical protein
MMKRVIKLCSGIVLFTCLACGSKDENEKPAPVEEEDNPELRLVNEDPSPLKGYKAIRQTVRERIVDDSSFELIKYLQDPNQGSGGGSILPLLGGFEGRGTTMSNQSAIPGPMNMLLWFVVVDGIASEVANHCSDAEEKIPLKERVQTAVKNICDVSVDPTESAEDLWDLLVKLDQSELQKLMWLDLLNKDHYKDDRAAYLRDAFIGALFSPEFLAGR